MTQHRFDSATTSLAVLSVAAPAPQPGTLDWPTPLTVAEFPHMVLAVAGTVHTPRGQELSADSAFATGVALLAAAWWAGFRSASQFTEAEHADVVVLPAPATPAWGDPGYLYFFFPGSYVAVRPETGTVIVGDGTTLTAPLAWAEGAATVAAARFVANSDEAVVA